MISHTLQFKMDIESDFRRRKILKTSQGVFDLSQCRWRAINSALSKRKEITNPPSQGYIHAASVLKGSLYTIIGPDEQYPEQGMYSYNFKINEWRYWSNCSLPDGRDSFGFTTHQSELYMFGGSSLDMQYGDTHVFSTFTCNWRQIQGFNPSPRNPMIFTDVFGQYIFMYGGTDVQKGLVLDDGYLLVDGCWKQLKVKNAPLGLIGAQSAVCVDQLFIFGGEIQEIDKPASSNSVLYQLSIDAQDLSVQFIKVPVANRSAPCNRTSHSMIGLENGCIMLVGGIGLEGESRNQILKDMWIYDVQELSWTRIDPANGPLRGFCQSWLCLSGGSLLVLGGLADRLDTWNQQIALIEFAQDETFRNEICSNCQQRASQRQKQEKAFPKTVVLSAGFFYNISLEYRHPFQAIVALYKCASYLQAQNFRFSISRGLNDNEYFQIEWNGRSLGRAEFQQFISHNSSGDADFTRFTSILKIASFRLGKTMLFINSDEKERRVFLFSADSKVAPEFDEIYGFFAYVENIERETIQSHEGRANEKIILNVLRSRLSNPENVLKRKGTHLLIFEKNILVTSEKVYYYELINSTNQDVAVYRNLKKIQFLQEMGYLISKEPEVSLASYLSILELNTLHPQFYINSSQKSIGLVNYLAKLREMEENAKISRFQLQNQSQNIQFQACLYEADDPDVIIGNLGILLYFEGTLVNRLDASFGDLFRQQFYKTKFKSAVTIFQFLGVINVKKGLTLNYLKNGFKKGRQYYIFMECLRSGMKKCKLQKMQKRARLASEQISERKQSRSYKV